MIKTSVSDILLYETCPHKWFLSKNGFKPNKQQLAFYKFGSALHYAINKSIFEAEDIVGVFDNYWVKYKDYLVYKDTTWEWLSLLGHVLLKRFQKEFCEKNITSIFGEKRLKLVSPDWEFIGQPDFVGYRDNVSRYLVMDFKTTDEKIDDFWVQVSDQMTAMAMLIAHEFEVSPPIDILVCNFVRSSENIFWMESIRNKDNIEAYKAKIGWKTTEMYINRNHSRRSLFSFDSPCSWCEFKGEICMGKTIKETGLNAMLKAVEI